MAEFNASLKVDEWMAKNGVSNCEFISFIGHVENQSVYGALFKTENGLLFQRHKWIEINKSMSPPKICAEVQYTFKYVNEDLWNSFKKLTQSEYMGRDAIDMNSI
jgi:hypothetical protein